MNTRMTPLCRGNIIAGTVLITLYLAHPMCVHAGSLNSPAAPNNSSSAMYSLEDVYNRLDKGTTGTKRSGAFTQPAAAPGSTGHSLDEIMSKAPAQDDTCASTPADVARDKTYWGLAAGAWGLQTGAAYPVRLPKTGQTISYAAGDDGDLEMGAALPAQRFTNHGDGTVTDNLTGLMWAQNASLYGRRSWANALSACNSSTLAGYTDWRLPNYIELISLIDVNSYNPILPAGHPFSNVQWSSTGSRYYWSSTTRRDASSSARVVWLANSYVMYKAKTETYYIWPVRGGAQ